MITTHVRIGLAGCFLIVASASVRAQDAAASCSGLGCLFSSHRDSQPAPAPAPAAVSMPAFPASELSPIADLDASSVKGASSAKKVVKAAPKPVHAVTIAANASEIARLKTIAAVMPKTPIRFVKTTSDDAEFTVTAALDQGASDRRVKLFTEQVHIVAGGGVHALADLKGKVVSFGPADGPTRAVARKAFDALAIPVKETPLDFENALDGLASGDIDAVVILAPQPSDVLKKVRAPGLHLIGWPIDGALPDGAAVSAISGHNYPHLAAAGDSIRAVGVDAILSMSSRGAKQPAAKSFFTSLAQHSAALSKRGFDLLKADLEERGGRKVASVDRSR